MQQVNEEELINRYGAKHILRDNCLEIESALNRRDEIVMVTRVRLIMVLAKIKTILEYSDAKAKQEKKLKAMIMMQAKRIMNDVVSSTETFYAWHMKREQSTKDRVRQRMIKKHVRNKTRDIRNLEYLFVSISLRTCDMLLPH